MRAGGDGLLDASCVLSRSCAAAAYVKRLEGGLEQLNEIAESLANSSVD